MTAPTVRQCQQALDHLGRARFDIVDHMAAEGASDLIGVIQVCAIGFRESGIRNVEGDHGFGCGWLQIDRRSHGAWLAKRAGCRSGSWEFAAGHRASEPGYVPGLMASTDYAIQLLRGNMEGARRAGVPQAHRFRVALAGYNGGLGNALRSYREGGVTNVDARTTGRDYSASVLATVGPMRRAARQMHWLP